MSFIHNARICTNTVETLRTQGAVAVPRILSGCLIKDMLRELSLKSLVRQPDTYGTYQVRQSFSAIDSFAPTSLFMCVKDEVQLWLNAQFEAYHRGRLAQPIRFTDWVVQQYEPGPMGISAHRDGKSFINLIVILALEGHGTFSICSNRTGDDPRPVAHEPGDVILMLAPGFSGEEIQPFHMVTDITTRRTTFSLRQKK